MMSIVRAQINATQTQLKKGKGYRIIHQVEGRPPIPEIQLRAF